MYRKLTVYLSFFHKAEHNAQHIESLEGTKSVDLCHIYHQHLLEPGVVAIKLNFCLLPAPAIFFFF